MSEASEAIARLFTDGTHAIENRVGSNGFAGRVHNTLKTATTGDEIGAKFFDGLGSGKANRWEIGAPDESNMEAAGIDDFGTFSDVLRGKVPMAELRPQRVEMFDRAALPLSDAEQEAMRHAHTRISSLLDEAQGNPLSRYQLRIAMRNINATRSINPPAEGMRSLLNCAETSLAVDDVLRGRPAVAGPLPGAPTGLSRAIYQMRAIEPHPLQSGLDSVENLIGSNARSRGIVIAYGGSGKNHIFNIANADGRPTYLDGEFGLVLEKRPRYVAWFKKFDFYRTA
ncbi:MAG: hypothetical protein J2P18_13020 [Nocardia sp.]|nr:hypothetical protein [Nocardia sp.]